MKYVIPLGAVLLIGVAASIHPAFVGPALPDRRVPVAPASGPGLLEAESPADPARSPSPRSEVLPKPAAPEEVDLPRKASEASWKKLSQQLERSLPLTELQQATVEQILRDREEDIRKCHDAIRKAGFVDLQDYDRQVSVMKGTWFRRIDSLLDRIQHERLVVLAQKGLFNEGLMFTLEPGMTVLD